MAEQAKREVATVEPRLEKALQANSSLNKVFLEITNLESALKISEERTGHQLESIETEMGLLEQKMMSQ